jgi:hypothetical protein
MEEGRNLLGTYSLLDQFENQKRPLPSAYFSGALTIYNFQLSLTSNAFNFELSFWRNTI